MKKGKKVPDSDDDSIILLSEEDAPLKKTKGKLVPRCLQQEAVIRLVAVAAVMMCC